jgi:DNA-binding transcriptional LysR family regulator
MAGKIEWESQIGRRLKLRDLHVFCSVVQRGSMAKAAAHLGVSQPAVSEVIADLEQELGVRLLDRGTRGVEPTIYGRALLKRGTIVFDELKQGIKDIECLSDPATGEVRIGCAEALASALLPPVLQRFSGQYPRVSVHVTPMITPSMELPELRERSLDLVLARLNPPFTNDEELSVEVLFDDHSVVAAGSQSKWACRRKIDLAELADEPWVLAPPEGWNSTIVAEAFRARGLAMPKVYLTTYSISLRAKLLATGPFISVLPNSVFWLANDEHPLRILPVDLPARPWPVAIVTLKNRTLNTVVARFIDHVRAFTRSIAVPLNPAAASPGALQVAVGKPTVA